MASKKHVFTPLERKIFVDILKKYAGVVESKETDGATLRAKNETWDKITSEYNASIASPHAMTQVTPKQLRRLWMNLKQRQRDIFRDHQNRTATGLLTGGGHSTSEKEYHDTKRRLQELHELEVDLMRHRVREAKAKADLAEYILKEKRNKNIKQEDSE